MKKLLIIIILSLVFINCFSTCKMMDKKCIPHYGVFTPEKKHSDYDYKLRRKSVILSILFCETIIVPFFLIGQKLFEPDSVRSNKNDK